MIGPCAAGARQGARSTSNSTAPRSDRCRRHLMSMRTGSSAGSISITTSRSRSISIRCRSDCCVNRWTRASRRRRWKSSIAASWWRRICAVCGRIGRPRWPSTCPVRIGAIATGRMNGFCARPPPSATTPRRWSRSSCARARIPNRASAPASASSAWRSATTPNGWTPPARGRWRWARARTARWRRF